MVSKSLIPMLAGGLAGCILLAGTILLGKPGTGDAWFALFLPSLLGICIFVIVVHRQQPSRIHLSALVASFCLAGAIIFGHVAALRTSMSGLSGPERFGLNVLYILPVTVIFLVVSLVLGLIASVQTVKHAHSYFNHFPLIATLAYVARLVAKVLI